MTFEWDEYKNLYNIAEHKIPFAEAQYAFFDADRIILKDEKHSQDEDRYFCIGKIERGIVTVRFTMRKKCIRIIGAGFWRSGRKMYEKR